MDEINWKVLRLIIKRAIDNCGLTKTELSRQSDYDRTSLYRFLSGRRETIEFETILKLYIALRPSMSIAERHAFLNNAGLLQLTEFLIIDTPLLDFVHDEPIFNQYKYAINLLSMAIKVGGKSWKDAIRLFEAAERLSPPMSAQAGNAASGVVQQLINLGDYGSAERKVRNTQAKYRHVIDPQLSCELLRVQGWLAYYVGEFSKAEDYFMRCILFAEKSGYLFYVAGAHHYLGRLYGDWTQLLKPGQDQEKMMALAEKHLNKSYEIRKHHGSDTDKAFDLLRIAQLPQNRKQWPKNRPSLDRVRSMLGASFGTLHIDLEEARMEILDNNRSAEKTAREALLGWSDLFYPKGLADALMLIGDSRRIDNDFNQAIEAYVAALCIYPYEANPMFRNAWDDLMCLKKEMDSDTGGNRHVSVAYTLRDLANQDKGFFKYLASIFPDRSEAKENIFEKLMS